MMAMVEMVVTGFQEEEEMMEEKKKGKCSSKYSFRRAANQIATSAERFLCALAGGGPEILEPRYASQLPPGYRQKIIELQPKLVRHIHRQKK